MKILSGIVVAVVCGLLAGCKTPSPAKIPQLVSVNKIWEGAPHNAFTDLIRFNHQWFCTFRESQSHLSGNGKIRVIASRDGVQWRPTALLGEDGTDLRDPKFSITPDGRLMLVFGGTVRRGKKEIERQPRVAFSRDGSVWTTPERVLNINDWLWRVTWHDHRAYGVVYNSAGARLVESDDGVRFRTVSVFDIPGRPNEATARFLKNGDCVVLIRREEGDKSAWIGLSSPPYADWKWSPAGLFVGGPNFIVLDDGSMVAGGRELNPPPAGAKMFIGKMNLQSVRPQLILPSGGDCSYPGLVWRDGLLWVSYYSSHEGKTCIYLAKVKL